MDRDSRISDRERAQLRGLVRTVVEETQETEYDQTGNLLSWRSKNLDGGEYGDSYTYNAQGRLQSVVSRLWDGSTAERVYSYDESGRLLSVVNTSGEHSTFDYDKHGHKTETRVLRKMNGRDAAAAIGMDLVFADIDGSLTLESRFAGNAASYKTIYDHRNQPTETQVYDRQGHVLGRLARSFDDKGRLTGLKAIIDDSLSLFPSEILDHVPPQSGVSLEEIRGQLAKQLSTLLGESGKSYSYNPEGRIDKATISDGMIGTFTRTYAYNEHGDIVEEDTVLARNAGMPIGVPFKLDDSGRMTPEKPPSEWPPEPDLGLPSKTHYSYKYDKEGNWIEKTTSRFQQSFTTHRKLTYYEAHQKQQSGRSNA
jgi:YD repeat-containing protein